MPFCGVKVQPDVVFAAFRRFEFVSPFRRRFAISDLPLANTVVLYGQAKAAVLKKSLYWPCLQI